jgi:hypothetical protein
VLTHITASIAALAAATLGTNFAVEAEPQAKEVKLSAVQATRALQRNVTVRFDNAPVAEVVKWLGAQGVSFAISQDELPSGRITLNIVDQPLSDSLKAIAAALGGRWERTGDIHVFRKGMGNVFAPSRMSIPEIRPGQQFEPFSPEARAKLQEQLLKERSVFGKEEMERVQAMRKQMEEMLKTRGEFRVEGPEGLKLREMIQGERLKGLMGDRIAVSRLQTGDLKQLLESLTPEQREKHERQGYLGFEDLTPAQQRMLNVKGDGNWTVSYSADGKKITIRSGK